jgi:hypothetical protein
VPYVRTVRTASGATAVQVVYFSQRGARESGHLGSTHDEAEPEALKAAQRLAAAQSVLDLGPCSRLRTRSPALSLHQAGEPGRDCSAGVPGQPAASNTAIGSR